MKIDNKKDNDNKDYLSRIICGIALIIIIYYLVMFICAFAYIRFNHINNTMNYSCDVIISEFYGKYQIQTKCGHVIIDRCPFCNQNVEIIIE